MLMFVSQLEFFGKLTLRQRLACKTFISQWSLLGRWMKQDWVEGESWTEMQSQSTNLMTKSASGMALQNYPKFQGEQILIPPALISYWMWATFGRRYDLGPFFFRPNNAQRKLRAEGCLPAALPAAEGRSPPFLERGLSGKCSIYHIQLQTIELIIEHSSRLLWTEWVSTKTHMSKPWSPV